MSRIGEFKDYRGEIVFLERLDDKGVPAYETGEYVVTEQSPHVLYAIKPEAGYAGYEQKKFSLVGTQAWKVIRCSRDERFLRELAKGLRHFGETPKRGEKSNWVDYVYTGALRNAERIEYLLGCSCDSEKQPPATPAKPDVCDSFLRIQVTKPTVELRFPNGAVVTVSTK
jgi:hypothetical protein